MQSAGAIEKTARIAYIFGKRDAQAGRWTRSLKMKRNDSKSTPFFVEKVLERLLTVWIVLRQKLNLCIKRPRDTWTLSEVDSCIPTDIKE